MIENTKFSHWLDLCYSWLHIPKQYISTLSYTLVKAGAKCCQISVFKVLVLYLINGYVIR